MHTHTPTAGLLKLVFATETLAAGINMPARTTLIAALSRRRDGGIGSLQHNELLQVRAGLWRGLDLSMQRERTGPVSCDLSSLHLYRRADLPCSAA